MAKKKSKTKRAPRTQAASRSGQARRASRSPASATEALAEARQSFESLGVDTRPDASRPTADGPYPYDEKLKRKVYESTLRDLQIELLKMQNWTKERGERVVIVFEGRDAAGKGGTIKRFREHLNPRGARLVALPKPNDTERGQWYFQRYIAQLPTAGEIVFFDRSWYNRAGVEPVMGFCSPEEYLQFMRQVPYVERGLIDSGIRMIKLWFDVGRAEQRRRIEARETDPLKHWKLSPMDYESINRWDAYTKARDSMFFYTHLEDSPWTGIRSDDKRRARIAAIRAVLNRLPYPDKDAKVVVGTDPQIVGPAPEMFPVEGRLIFNVVRA